MVLKHMELQFLQDDQTISIKINEEDASIKKYAIFKLYSRKVEVTKNFNKLKSS